MSSVLPPLSLRVLIVFAVTLAAVLFAASVVHAQTEDQYGSPTAPSGPAAGEPVKVLGDTDGIVNQEDTLIVEGDYTVSDGASITFGDADGTQGTLIDGENATIVEGSIEISPTGAPVNVVGGNKVLNIKGLSVVATTGVAKGSDAGAGIFGGGKGQRVEDVAGVLPGAGDTGLLLTLGVLALAGAGGLALRYRRASNDPSAE